MQIIDKFRGLESLDDQGITRVFPNGETKTIPQNVACEHHMDVTINTIPTFRIVCSPDHLPELVIGRLYSEGIIQGTDELEQVYVCDLGNRCEVILKDKYRADFSRNEIAEIPTCCTGNQTLNAYFSNNELPEPVTPIEWDKEWIFKMCEYFKVDSPAHKKSYGTHSCYITQKGDFEAGKNPIMCEDLGRHNAFDKALGCALIAGYDIKNFLFALYNKIKGILQTIKNTFNRNSNNTLLLQREVIHVTRGCESARRLRPHGSSDDSTNAVSVNLARKGYNFAERCPVRMYASLC